MCHPPRRVPGVEPGPIAVAIEVRNVVRVLGRATAARGFCKREIVVREPVVQERPTKTEPRHRLVCSMIARSTRFAFVKCHDKIS